MNPATPPPLSVLTAPLTQLFGWNLNRNGFVETRTWNKFITSLFAAEVCVTLQPAEGFQSHSRLEGLFTVSKEPTVTVSS